MSIGVNIKALRERFGYTQSDLAELTGISQPLIWYYESAKKIPSVVNAEKIAKVFNVTIEELMYGKEKNT